MTGAFRTTAKAELEVEMHIPPIEISLYQAVESSLNRIRGSPLYYKIQQLRRSAPSKFKWYSPLQKLEHTVVLRLEEGTPPMEVIRPEIICPWTEPPKIHITKGTEAGKLEHNQIAREAKSNLGHVLAYTDGSEINGEVGASACIPELGTKAANYMGTNQVSTVYAGELRGLQLALDLALKHSLIIRRLTIFTDNQAAIQAVAKPRNHSGQYLVHGVRERL